MSPAKQRRTAPRYDVPPDWSVTFRSEDQPAGAWCDARLIDLSETGVALEPIGMAADLTLVGRLELHLVPPSSDGEGLRLLGEIRHMTRSSRGRVRVGIQFVGLTPNEEKLLDLVLRLS